MPRTFEAWAAYLADCPADALFILGDLFEVWVGDDAAQRPFESRCVDLLRQATARHPVWLMHGNRDFLVGAAFARATGVRLLADPTALAAFGEIALLSHGDALCLADAAYQRFRAEVRAPSWQATFLAQPLSARVEAAARMRAASRAHQRNPVTLADADPVLVRHWLDDAGADLLIHGHTHRPGSDAVGGATRHVLSDWDLDSDATAPRAEILRWTADGFRRLTPAQARRGP